LAKNADLIGKAWFQGKLYKIDDYPGAVLSDNSEDKVFGEVYCLHHAETLLPVLDRYEECAPDFPEPHEYLRQKQAICLNNGDWIAAWVYLYNRPVDGLECNSRQFNEVPGCKQK
jgi:gamma-glutamylcyclotransferase (GGCT)/AIG2-like uncharacterized protein YtfP